MNIKVSILIPVYNVEKYLSRCIESVLSQNFLNYEVILVDDGSSDRSGNICDEYSKKYPNIIKVIHKMNGGHNSARLSGFQIACGKYIMFLDSDDYLLPNALSILYNKIEEGYDIVRGGYKMVSVKSEKLFSRNDDWCIEGNKTFREKLIYGNIDSFLWGGLYKKELLKENDFKDIIDLSIGEDWCTNFILASRIKKVYILKDIIYAYWVNEKSIMHKTIASHNYIERMHKPLIEIIKDDPYLMSLLNAHRIAAHINLGFHHEIKYEDQYRIEFNEYIKLHGEESISKMLGKRYYLAFRYSKIMFRIFRIIISQIMKYKKYKGISRRVIY